jgi:hypothetical protein
VARRETADAEQAGNERVHPELLADGAGGIDTAALRLVVLCGHGATRMATRSRVLASFSSECGVSGTQD